MCYTLAVTPKLRVDTFKISNDHIFLDKIFICVITINNYDLFLNDKLSMNTCETLKL